VAITEIDPEGNPGEFLGFFVQTPIGDIGPFTMALALTRLDELTSPEQHEAQPDGPPSLNSPTPGMKR
jgi:hypothetical protein